MIKKVGKAVICSLLERQVRSLRRRNSFKLIAVAGSVGKTSTKLAIAQLLATRSSVCYQDGNYNDRLTVPLIFFNQPEPGIFNVAAWLKILWSNQRMLKRPYAYEFVVVELGPDGPGQMQVFAYLQPDLTVLTAVAPEHMEFFKTLDSVAAEETKVFDYSQQMLVNHDDVDTKYLTNRNFRSYGLTNKADYYLSDWQSQDLKAPHAELHLAGEKAVQVELQTLGHQGAKINLAAAAVAHELGFSTADIVAGMKAIKPASGRMQLLEGKNGATIIDDTYNASPLAMTAALDVLYAAQAKQKIAVLGNMNELGDVSQQAHTDIGQYCDPKKISLLLTLGTDANRYLAAAAKEQGCDVVSFDNAQEIGRYLGDHLNDDTLILAKGSEGRVYLEEAVKMLLADPADAKKLVRQSPAWLTKKRKHGLDV